MSRPLRGAVALAGLALTLGTAGCGAGSTPHPSAAIRALERESRPIGVGPRFRSRARGPVLGACRRGLGPRTASHVEVFAENRVVLLPLGIGVRGPVRLLAGRIAAARCYGELVTIDPTGTILVRSGTTLTLAALFRSWGVPLSRTRLAGFQAPAGSQVRVDVDGHPRAADPPRIVLSPHAEIVLEVGPRVPPHRSYAFPPGE